MSKLQLSTKYQVEKLDRLIDGRVKSLAIDVDSGEKFGEEYFGLVFEMPNGDERVMWIWADDDGNGPGAVTIQERGQE